VNYKRRFKILWMALRDFLSDNYLYHSAALSYVSLMSFFSIFIVVFVMVSYIPFDLTRVTDLFARLFPEHSFDYVALTEKLARGRTTIGLLGFVLAYYFATNLFRQLNRAILFVVERRQPVSRYWYRHLVSIPALLILLFIIYVVSLSINWIFSVIADYVSLPGWLRFLSVDIGRFYTYLIDFLVFSVFLFFIYFMYLAHKDNLLPENIIIISLLEGFVLTFLKHGFAMIYKWLVKGNPLFGTFATVLFFLLWMYLMYGIILYGARVIYYSEKEE